jgi:hypothetical protein
VSTAGLVFRISQVFPVVSSFPFDVLAEEKLQSRRWNDWLKMSAELIVP